MTKRSPSTEASKWLRTNETRLPRPCSRNSTWPRQPEISKLNRVLYNTTSPNRNRHRLDPASWDNWDLACPLPTLTTLLSSYSLCLKTSISLMEACMARTQETRRSLIMKLVKLCLTSNWLIPTTRKWLLPTTSTITWISRKTVWSRMSNQPCPLSLSGMWITSLTDCLMMLRGSRTI